MNLSAAEKRIIRKLAAELDADEGQDEYDDEPRARRSAPASGRHRRPARVADRVDSDADVFVLRGPSADRFLASLGIGGADDQGEDEGQDDADEGQDDESEAPARQDPEPAARTHRYFR